MKIKNIKIFTFQAGWKPWKFLKIETNTKCFGWADCTDTFGNLNGFIGILKDFKNILMNEEITDVNKIVVKLKIVSSSNRGSLVQRVISAIENAILDIIAKNKNVPVFLLFKKPKRNAIELYWSHCGTTRVRTPQFLTTPAIKKLSDVKYLCHEINKTKFKVIKTNLALFEKGSVIYMPGHKTEFNNYNLDLKNSVLREIKAWINEFNKYLNKDIFISVDLNFNFKKKDLVKIAKALQHYRIKWLEIDTYTPEPLSYLKKFTNLKIATGETIMFLDELKLFIDSKCCDFISTDVVWSGFHESLKVSNYANKKNIPITTHNYNGDLGTFMSLNLATIVKNFSICEIDIDEFESAKQIFTKNIAMQGNYVKIPSGPGWGTSLIESKIKLEFNAKF